MHAYSSDSPERRYIPLLLAAGAIGAAYSAFDLLENYNLHFYWWASPPIDTMAFYGLFYWVFNQYLWKWPLLRWLRATRVPDLSGQWHGTVRPTSTHVVYDGLGEEHDILLSIRQTWTELLIIGRTDLSTFRSLSASFLVSDSRSLSYEYWNEPSAKAATTMHAHRGVARLTIAPDSTILEGEYFSGRDRQNVGTITLKRIQSD